jgi:molybdopterin-guanine dinucleotide biosynthesis protein A
MAPSLGLLILAGGPGSRMGADKPALPFPGPGDPPLLRRIAARMETVAGPPTIAGPHDYGTGWPVVADEPGFEGPVGGLIAGLAAAPEELVLVLAADLPFPSPKLARGLAEIARRDPRALAVVPRRGGRLEPLFAVYRPGAVEDLRKVARELSGPGRGPRLRSAVAGIGVLVVEDSDWRRWDRDGASFINCNTPAELAAAADRALEQPEQGESR